MLVFDPWQVQRRVAKVAESNADFARRAGLTPQQFSAVLAWANNPSKRTLRKLADALKCDWRVFFTEEAELAASEATMNKWKADGRPPVEEGTC